MTMPTLSCGSAKRVFTLASLTGLLAAAGAPAAPPTFAVRPAGNEHAFTGSVYQAVIVPAGCPQPRVIIDEPAGAVYEDETLKYVPPGRAGESFIVRVRAVNADGEAAEAWRVTLADPLALEFDVEAEYSANFTADFARVPAVQLGGLATTVRGGDVWLHIPATGPGPADNLDSWCGVDRTPRWLANLKVFGAFELETRLYFPNPPPVAGNGYHVGLVLDRGDQDLTILGAIRDQIEMERTCLLDGDRSDFPSFPGAASSEISLRVVGDGKEQSFWARRNDTDPWSIVDVVRGPRPPIRGVGLAVKTWADQGFFRAGFRYFRYRGRPAGPPRLDEPEADLAFRGGEYAAALPVLSDQPATITVLSPAGATVGADRVFRYSVPDGAGDFSCQVRVQSAGGQQVHSWTVAVRDPFRYEFDSLGEFTANFLDYGFDDSTRKGEIRLAASGGRLLITLPAAARENFDGWCGFDRSPRWLHYPAVTGSFAVETALGFTVRPPVLADGYHLGLAADRGPQDLALLGAIRNGVEYERTCARDCEDTGTFFAGLWNDPAASVQLRLESRGLEQILLARRDPSAAWTLIDRVQGQRPRPIGLGLGAKNWDGQGELTAAFDYFEYGPPGVHLIAAPGDGTAGRGSTYAARVRAWGVRPRYSFAAAPADATVDPLTGEVRYLANDPVGTRLAFAVRAACGLEEVSASWTVVVTGTAPAVRLTSFTPAAASYLGKTPFVATGANFTALTRVVIDGLSITPSAASATTLNGTLPPHDATTLALAVSVRDPDRGTDTLPGVLRYEGPLGLTAVSPDRALEGDTPGVTVTGTGFTPATVIAIGGQPLTASTWVGTSAIRGRAPALTPGTYDVTARDTDANGTRVDANVLGGAFRSVPQVRITSFAPGEASYFGKTSFELQGANFTPGTQVIIDGAEIVPVLAGTTTLRGMIPAHAPTESPLAVTVKDPERGIDTLDNALRYAGPLAVSGVTPSRVAFGQRPPVTISGLGFTPETRVFFGDQPLANLAFADVRTITGTAPELPPGQYAARAADTDAAQRPVNAPWTSQVVYEAPPRFVPPPAEIEATLAEGTLRAYWRNPVAYAQVRVLDGEGAFLFSLAGDATSFEMEAPPIPAGGAVKFQLQGALSVTESSEAIGALAVVPECFTPPPLGGASDPGFLELPVFGSHQPGVSLRCNDTAGGGGAGLPEAVIGFAPMLKSQDGTGVIIPESALGQPKPNELRTGFRLLQDAEVLEIHAYYRRVVAEFGVSLRGRLVQVHLDGTEGFSDEFTFPAPLVGDPKKKHRTLYFRAQSDPGLVPTPAECHKKVPAGEYRLEIYTVGGDPGTAYYQFGNDPRIEPIDIPGVPCPPFPWVEVRNVSGLQTLPDIKTVSGVGFDSPFGFFAKLTAQGQWTDGSGSHDVPAEPGDFEYQWRFIDLVPPVTDGHGPILVTNKLPGLSCYQLELTVRDKACGKEVESWHEVRLEPVQYAVDPVKYTFQFPNPPPQTIEAIGSLRGAATPGGGARGSFSTARPLRFRVFVVPPGASVEEAKKKPVVPAEFDLKPLVGGAELAGADFKVVDLCPNDPSGPKYLEFVLDDAGAIPLPDDWPAIAGRSITLQGYRQGQPLNAIGQFRLHDRPRVLETAFWSGSYNAAEDAYEFAIQPGKYPVVGVEMGKTEAVSFDVEGKTITIPAFENQLASGFTARFRFDGTWEAAEGTGAASGEVLGNKVAGQSLTVAGTETIGVGVAGSSEGSGGLILPSDVSYGWSDVKEIFKHELHQTLFQAILYTGTIGPVPVTIWASVGLALEARVTAKTEATVEPFQDLATNRFTLSSALKLSLPAKIRADILLGVASVEARLVPKGCFELATLVGSHGAETFTDRLMNATLSIALEAEACIHLVIKDLCYQAPTLHILSNRDLLPGGEPTGELKGAPTQCGGGGTGGQQAVTLEVDAQSRVLTALSPGGYTRLDCWVLPEEAGQPAVARCAFTELPGTQKYVPPEPPTIYESFSKLDPAGVFLNDNLALVAWTESLDKDTPGWPLPTLDETAPEYPHQLAARQNALFRQREIAVTAYVRQPGILGWKGESLCLISDGASCAAQLPQAGRRADGSAAMAAGKNVAEAMLAWVRYEAPEVLLLDGTKVVPKPVLDAQGNPLTDAAGNTVLAEVTVPNYRPQLETTAIYARRVGAAGPIGAAVKLSPPGINIEPALAMSPSGKIAYCVWVHDPVHHDLIASNRSRRLLFSRWQDNTGWSPPASVLPAVADYDAFYPGVLEPDIALQDAANGVLVFDALPAGADELDTGLAGGGRLVYAVHLVNGQFLDPVLLRDECGFAVYGRWVTIDPGMPLPIEDNLKVFDPGWVMMIHKYGNPGSEAGRGGLVTSIYGPDGWTSPVEILVPGAGTLDNVSAGVGAGGAISFLAVEGPCAIPALCGPGEGGGAGVSLLPEIRSGEVRLEPDLALDDCRLSDASAAPGARVMARVTVRNRGLGWSPVDVQDRPATGLRFVFLEEGGGEREVRRATLPAIAPGAAHVAEVELEAPHDPVSLRVEIDPNPIDRDRANDHAECFFGTPCPRDLACEYRSAPSADAPDAVRLGWTNPALYDQILVYRDGGLLAALPGGCQSFVDRSPPAGEHRYCVRGRTGASKSSRAAECRVSAEPSGVVFRRGDANADRRINITDGIYLLNFLFLGDRAPRCFDAADTNDDGGVNITDGIYLLNFLFLGGRAIPLPGTETCGADPTTDALPACGGPGACP